MQLDRLAQRAVMGIARVGGVGEHSSGDFVVSFSTANANLPPEDLEPAAPFSQSVEMLINAHLSPLFEATADATEELVREATDAEAYSVLKKPVRKADLLQTVDAAMVATYCSSPFQAGPHAV